MSRVSRTASTRQPVARKPLWVFDEYQTTNNRPALSARVDIRDMARFYAEDARVAGGYEPDWATATSSYVPQRIHNADDALDALAAFQFPPDIRRNAQRAARQLTDVFGDVARLQRVAGLTIGRIDRRKFPAIAREVAAGTYDVNHVRPYRKTLPAPTEKPTLAVVASAGNAEMWKEADYIPRVLTLVLSILWACEAAGLNTYAALTKSHTCARRCGDAVMGVMLAQPGQAISPRTYGVALHRDLWRYGEMTLQQADYAANRRVAQLQDRQPDAGFCGYAWPCANGGNATHWAYQVLKAHVVITIGAITDRAMAHIRLDARIEADQAVEEIVRQMQRLA